MRTTKNDVMVPGLLRAARKISKHNFMSEDAEALNYMADIINGETGCGEMLQALKLCRNWISTEGKFTASDHQELMKDRLLKLSAAAIQRARR